MGMAMFFNHFWIRHALFLVGLRFALKDCPECALSYYYPTPQKPVDGNQLQQNTRFTKYHFPGELIVEICYCFNKCFNLSTDSKSEQESSFHDRTNVIKKWENLKLDLLFVTNNHEISLTAAQTIPLFVQIFKHLQYGILYCTF